jgi:hypothetical protein
LRCARGFVLQVEVRENDAATAPNKKITAQHSEKLGAVFLLSGKKDMHNTIQEKKTTLTFALLTFSGLHNGKSNRR